MVSGKLFLVVALAAACCSVCSAIPQLDKVDKYMHCESCGKYSLIVDGFVVSLYNLLMGVGLKVPHALGYALHLTVFLAAVLGNLLNVNNHLIWDGVSNMVKEVIANEYLRAFLKECGLKLISILECVLSQMHTALNW